MAVSRHGVNAIDVGEAPMLLTVTSGGTAIHLARTADDSSPGQGAVPDFYFDTSRPWYSAAVANYTADELLTPRWAKTTLCGRAWVVMAGGEGGPLREDGDVAFAPTCRRCLALIDRYYPKPPADRRFSLVAQLATDIVCEQGFAEVRGVPGDQQTELRKTIRKLVRDRTGHATSTFCRDSTVYIECPEIYSEHAIEHSRAGVEAISEYLAADNEPHPRKTAYWVVSWETWNVD